MTALLDARIRLADGVVIRDFPTESVAVHLGTGRFHGLNPTAALMLAAVLEAQSGRDAVPSLATRFGEDENRIAGDLAALLDGLAERSLIDAEAPRAA